VKASLNQIEGHAFSRSRMLPRHTISTLRYEVLNIHDMFATLGAEESPIYLVRFYNIHGYEQWGQTPDDPDQILASNTKYTNEQVQLSAGMG